MDLEKFDLKQFEKRKKDHIELAMQVQNQTYGMSGLDQVTLEHNAIPDVNFSEITFKTNILGKKLNSPLYINSMTAGHKDAIHLNAKMAAACQEHGWMMGVGSQRRQLTDSSILNEWKRLRKESPSSLLIANIGIAQLIQSSTSDIRKLVDCIEAQAIFIHVNGLQECLQPEGTTNFKGSFKAIERLTSKLNVPVILKETGCGFSANSMKKLKNLGLYAVDISGLGGTHWGRIEGERAIEGTVKNLAAKTFQNWGIGTVQSLLNGLQIKPDYHLWASGGVRSGLDAAKLLALGAQAVGYAKPAMEAALQGEKNLHDWMSLIEFELKTAMFCTGSENLKELKKIKVRTVCSKT